MEVHIENPSKSNLASGILESAIAMIERKEDISHIEKINVPNQKDGGIIFGIFLSITANALYDLLKVAIKRHSKREDYDSSIILIIDGKKYSLEEIIEK